MTAQHAPRRRNVARIVLVALGVVTTIVVGLGIAFVVALSQVQF